MKKCFGKFINGLIGRMIVLVMVLIVTFGGNVFVNASDKGNVEKYDEINLNVKVKHPEKGFFSTSLNKNGELQAFEWTKAGGRIIVWEGKTPTFKTVKIPKNIMKNISSSGDGSVSYGVDGCLYIITEKNDKNILYGVDEKGNAVTKIKLPKLSDNGVQIRAPKQINKNRLAFTAIDNVTADCYVFVINKKNKKVVSKYKTNVAVEEIKGKRVYGFSTTSHYDEENTLITDSKKLVVMDLYKNKIINQVEVPGSFSASHQIDVKGSFVYLVSNNGVFRKKEKDMLWTNVMTDQYNDNVGYTETAITDLTVASEKELYITYVDENDLPVLLYYTNK